jgi:hypothetical protein
MKVFMHQAGSASRKLVLSETADEDLEGVFRTQCKHLQEIIAESPYWRRTFWRLEQPERERQEREWQEQWQQERERQERNLLEPFFVDCCVRVPEACASTTALYEAYKKWAQANGIKDYMSHKAFGGRLRKQFPVITGRTIRYANIGLKEGPDV